MPSNQMLDLSNVISVSVSLTPSGLGEPNINACALISKEEPTWFGTKAFAVYKNPTDVETDWGASSDAFAIATEFFAQNPNPVSASGYLVIIPRLQSPSLETAQAAIARTLNSIFYFGILIDEELAQSAPSTFTSLTNYVQTLDKMFFYASSSIADLNPGSALDLVRQRGDINTRCLYYGNPIDNGAAAQQTQMFAAAYAGRALTTNFDGSLTASTMNLKQLVGVTPDQTVDQTALNAAEISGVDLYVLVSTFACLLTSGANEYFDEVYGLFWLKFAIQVAGFNYLAQTNTKIPQTEKGMNGLKDAYRAALVQGVTNGLLAPGGWNSPVTFGPQGLLPENISNIGYYVFSLPIAQQSQSDRNARKAPLVQIAAKLAGAIHSSSVVVSVNP